MVNLYTSRRLTVKDKCSLTGSTGRKAEVADLSGKKDVLFVSFSTLSMATHANQYNTEAVS